MTTAPASRGRRRFLLIAAIFFTPMVIAWSIYFGPDSWKPQGLTNHGELISPAQPLELGEIVLLDRDAPEVPWDGKWTLLQVWTGPCTEECVARIVDMRQLRKSLHRRRDRVQRLLLLPSRAEADALQQQLAAEHPLLRFGVLAPARHEALDAQLRRDVPLTVNVVDPLGNYLMRYTPEVDLRGMYKDVMKLLKLSNIG